MLDGKDDQLDGRLAAMARFASTLTAQPWAMTPQLRAGLAEHGLDEDAIEAATGVVAVFNYLTRVADASGIEFDYESPLPQFTPQRQRRAVERPEPRRWPVVGPPFRTFGRFDALREAWQRWQDYVFDSDEPLTRRERAVLARAAAAACCDRWRVEQLADAEPDDATETRLAGFADALSREPWRMRPADLQVLRDLGYPEPALLHAIAVVALQNAQSRVALAIGLGAGLA